MTTLQKKSRSESVRQRRSSPTRSRPVATSTKPGMRRTTGTAKQAYHPGSVYLPVEPRTIAGRTLRQSSGSKPTHGKTSSRMVKNSARYGSEFSFSLGRTAVHAPALNLPTLSIPALGPRWVSAGLTLLFGIMLYAMWTANTFQVTVADVSGNQRLDSSEINSMLGMVGQPIFKAVPAQIEQNLRTAFPDLAKVSVSVGLPNHIRVNVVERTPVLIWSQEGVTTWIDTNGIAFRPRGDVTGLIPIVSNGNPPKLAVDPAISISDQPFVDASLVQAVIAIHPQVPDGAPIIYDPKYGLGWQDPRGWSVYFGLNTQDISMKKIVYQAILDTFNRQGIQPTLISVAYLDAPFYK